MVNINSITNLDLKDRENLIKQLEAAIDFIHLMEKELAQKTMSKKKLYIQHKRYDNAIRYYNELIKQAKKQNISCSKEELANSILK